MNPSRATRGGAWPAIRLALLGCVALLIALLAPQPANAHAALETSDPANGDVLATMPAALTLTFTEPLEQSYSRLELYDSVGVKVEGTSFTFGDDGYTMVLTPPGNLPNGTYSVLWRTLSEADGHTAQNYIAFTIGTNADIAAVAIPGTGSNPDSVPQWAKASSRWAALLGVAALIACWPVWFAVIRPALGAARPEAIPTVRRMRRFAAAAVTLAAAGSIYALVVQALTLPEGTFLDQVIDTLGQTRYGHLWLARFGLIAVLGLVLAACGWWFTQRRQVEGVAAWIMAAAVTVPFSLIAHASAQRAGRTFAILADAIHLFASSVWAGGIAILVAVLLPGVWGMSREHRDAVLRIALPRFSTLALICMAVIGVTGFYAGWLEVGNLTALTTTSYGKALIIKLGLLAGILVLAAVNLFVIERRVRRSESGGRAVWSRRVRWTVTGELAGVVLLLLAVGQMTSLQPARDVVTEKARQVEVSFTDVSPSSTLLLAPGVAGVNHFRLEVGGPTLPADAEALLRLTIPGNEDLGTKEIQLSRVAGNAFEHHGSELSIAADWQVTAIIREKGKAPVSSGTDVSIGTTPPDVDVPGDPWRFETLGGATGLLLVLAGLAALIVAIRTSHPTTRKESGGLGVAALLLGVILLFQARIDPILANAPGGRAIDPEDVAMVERGEAVYTQQCLSCHGAELRGDGPASEGMDPPPADFSSPHTGIHADEDLIYWVRNGKQGTAMPGFDNSLTDQEIRDVLSYIAAQQAAMQDTAAGTGPESCTVAPLAIDQVVALAGAGATPGEGTTAVASDAPVGDEIATGIDQTITQLIACTNAGDTMRRLSLFSDRYLAETFSPGLTADFEEIASAPPAPLPANRQSVLVEVRDVRMLEDGRVVATVETSEPGDTGLHVHDPSAPEDTADRATVVTELVFVRVGDRWLVDDLTVP